MGGSGDAPRGNWEFDPRTAELIRFKVDRLIGRHDFTASDADDLRQELSAHVAAGRRSYDPARSSQRTFEERIVTSRVRDLIDHAVAKKRDRRRERPLDDASSRPAPGPGEAGADLRLDVAAAVASLPDDLRRLATLLSEHTEAEAVRASGLSRQTIRGMKLRLAAHLRAAGLGPPGIFTNANQPARARRT